MEREDIRIEPPEKVVRFITAPGHIYRRKIKIVRIIVRPIRRTVRHPSAAVADTVSKMPVSQFSAGSFTIFFRFAPYAWHTAIFIKTADTPPDRSCRGDSSKFGDCNNPSAKCDGQTVHSCQDFPVLHQ